MSNDKVVYLAFRNPAVPTETLERLACATCRNKTFTVEYDIPEGYPMLCCSVCGARLGRFGWADQ